MQMSHGVYWSCTLFELLLLGKAVVVAVLGEEQLLPPHPGDQPASRGDVGLLCMYVCVIVALLCSFMEGWLGQRIITQRRKQHEAADEVSGGGSSQQPLLGGKGKVAQETDSATIPALIKLSAPDSHILFLAFTAGAAAALGQASSPGCSSAFSWCRGKACVATPRTRECNNLHTQTRLCNPPLKQSRTLWLVPPCRPSFPTTPGKSSTTPPSTLSPTPFALPR
jgi:hypothetical protein